MALFNKLFQKRTNEFEQVKKDLMKDLDTTIQMCDNVARENEQIKQQLLVNLDRINTLMQGGNKNGIFNTCEKTGKKLYTLKTACGFRIAQYKRNIYGIVENGTKPFATITYGTLDSNWKNPIKHDVEI